MQHRPASPRRAIRLLTPLFVFGVLTACAEDEGTTPAVIIGEPEPSAAFAFVDFPLSIDPLTSGQLFRISTVDGVTYEWGVRGGEVVTTPDATSIGVTPEAGAPFVVIEVVATNAEGLSLRLVDSTPIARRVTHLEGGTYGVAIGPQNRLASMLWLSQTVRFRSGRHDPSPQDVTTGSIPVHGAFSNHGQTFYVVEQDGWALRSIDVESGATKAVDYGHTMFNIAISPVDGMVFTTTADGWLFKSDPSTLAKLDSLFIGYASNGLAINANGFWVTTMDGRLLQVDPATMAQLDLIELGGVPQRVAIDEDAAIAYVANEGGPGLQVITLASHEVRSVPVAGIPYGVALAPRGKEVWVAVRDAGRIDLFATADMALTGSLDVGGIPRNIAFSANGHLVLIGNEAGSVLVER
jgi:DNA-binding beta-propeller fold protein YncE